MPKQSNKLKLSSLNRPASKSARGASKHAATQNASAHEAEPTLPRSQLLPGGLMLWCLVGLAVGLSAWLGGRTYLKRALAAQLTSASSEAVALQSIDALLRLDANATIEVSRGLAHPEFMVANAAFRALGGQLDAWTKLEPADRLLRMQKVVAELERIPEDIDQDHRILVSGLASRIYADALSSREIGAGDLLEGCRRVLARTDPQHVPTRVARLNLPSDQASDLTSDRYGNRNGNRIGDSGNELPSETQPLPEPEGVSPVPPPLAPLEPSVDSYSAEATMAPTRLTDRAAVISSKRNLMNRKSLSDQEELLTDAQPTRLRLTSGPNALPHSTALAKPSAVRQPELNTQETIGPLSGSSSSRSRVIPPEVEPLPGELAESSQTVPLSGIEQLPIDQLVRLLSSVQPRVSQAAALTLRQRGMSEENLEMAVKLATGSMEDRQQLLSQLVQRDDLDARPWLLWMAADGQDAIRQHAVALLQPLADTDVRRQLRLLLNKERDEKVAQTIRQVLLK